MSRNIMRNISTIEVLCVILLAVISSETTQEQCTTEMYTDKHVYTVGETIHLNCSATPLLAPDPAQFYILHATRHNKQGTNISAIFNLTGSVAMTEIVANSVSDSGTYICYYGNCTHDSLTSFETIVVKSSVLQPNVSCVWVSYWNLTCQWEMTETAGALEWHMAYIQEGTTSPICCLGPSGSCDDFSADTSCCIPSSQLVPYLTYQMQLTVRWEDNSTETYNYIVTVDESILRCHLSDVAVSTNTVRELNLTATSDCVPASVGGVICHVTASSQWEPNTTVTRVCASRSTGLELSCGISGLDPFTKYNLSIRCRPNASALWSNILVTKATTLAEPPVMSPDVEGYSDVRLNNGVRNIALYMKPLPQRQYYGSGAEFTVKVDSMHGMVELVFDADVYTAIINATLLSNTTYVIAITSRNEIGASSHSTVVDVAISETSASNGVIVVDQRSDMRYDVFVCGYPLSASTCYYTCPTISYGSPTLCKKQLVRTCVDGFHDVNTVMVDTDDDLWHLAAFGVSFKRDTGTTDIIWSDCVFRFVDDRKFQALAVSGRRINASTVEVALNFRYCSLARRPLAYQVEAQTTNHNCTFEGAENVTATPLLQQLLLTVDHQDKDVKICFKAVYADYTYDVYDDVSVLAAAADDRDAQGNSASVELIVGVSVGSVVCSLLIGIILWLRRYQKRVRSRNLVADIITDLSVPNDGYTNLSDTETTGDQSYTNLHCTELDGNQESLEFKKAVTNESIAEMTEKYSSKEKRDIITGDIGENVDNVDQNSVGINGNPAITITYTRQVDTKAVTTETENSYFKTKEPIFKIVPTLLVTQRTNQTDRSNSVLHVETDNDSENEATGSDVSVVTMDTSGIDSYTVIVCNNSESGQSISDYVTSTEMTSFSQSSF